MRRSPSPLLLAAGAEEEGSAPLPLISADAFFVGALVELDKEHRFRAGLRVGGFRMEEALVFELRLQALGGRIFETRRNLGRRGAVFGSESQRFSKTAMGGERARRPSSKNGAEVVKPEL